MTHKALYKLIIFLDTNGKRKNPFSNRKRIQDNESTCQQIRENMESKESEKAPSRIKSFCFCYQKDKEGLEILFSRLPYSPSFFILLMAIDDFCFQINQVLIGGIMS